MTSSNCLFCLERLIALSPTTKESSKSPLELRDFFCIDFSLQLCLREYKTLNAPQSPDKHKPVQISPKLGNYFDINGHLLPLEPLSWLVVLSFFKFLVLNQEWTPTESQLYLMCFGLPVSQPEADGLSSEEYSLVICVRWTIKFQKHSDSLFSLYSNWLLF